jgi:hypothetical protein
VVPLSHIDQADAKAVERRGTHRHDPDDTLVRVCGQGDRDYKIHRKTQWFVDVHQAVEFTLCREEGAKFVPDPDTCTRSTIAL